MCYVCGGGGGGGGGVNQRLMLWNCFKGNIGETTERRGGAYMGLPERIDTVLN